MRQDKNLLAAHDGDGRLRNRQFRASSNQLNPLAIEGNGHAVTFLHRVDHEEILGRKRAEVADVLETHDDNPTLFPACQSGVEDHRAPCANRDVCRAEHRLRIVGGETLVRRTGSDGLGIRECGIGR